MISASQIKLTTTQGRLAVDVTHGDTTCRHWYINNEGGKWVASATLDDGTLLLCDKDLAQHIEFWVDRDTLTSELAEIMNVYNYADEIGGAS